MSLALTGCARGAVVTPAPAPTPVLDPALVTIVATPFPSPCAPPRGAITTGHVRELLSVLADDSMGGRMTGSRGSAMAADYIAAQFQAAGLQPAGDSGWFQRVPVAVVRQPEGMLPDLMPSFADLDTVPAGRKPTAVNVLGILPGSDSLLRDEVVLVNAHYDHLGVGEPVDGDSIYNGADDDASGTVAVMEIARVLGAGPRPKRTVMFAAMTGEEEGLLGTRWFIAHPAVPFERIVANLEIEMIGRPDSLAGGAGKGWLTGYDRSTMGAMLAAAGIPLVADPHPEMHFFERSDNIAFAMKGIPAHTLSSYNLHGDYHTPRDDLFRVDVDHMAKVIEAGARAVRMLADGEKPAWVPGGRPAEGRR